MKMIPFPQANNLELLLDIILDINEKGVTKFDISKRYELNIRQGAYYLDALLYIGLIEKVNIKYFLNSAGFKLQKKVICFSKHLLCEELLKNPFLSNTYINTHMIDDKKKKLEIISNCIQQDFQLNGTTVKRRSSTILNWLDWIKSNERETGYDM